MGLCGIFVPRWGVIQYCWSSNRGSYKYCWGTSRYLWNPYYSKEDDSHDSHLTRARTIYCSHNHAFFISISLFFTVTRKSNNTNATSTRENHKTNAEIKNTAFRKTLWITMSTYQDFHLLLPMSLHVQSVDRAEMWNVLMLQWNKYSSRIQKWCSLGSTSVDASSFS